MGNPEPKRLTPGCRWQRQVVCDPLRAELEKWFPGCGASVSDLS